MPNFVLRRWYFQFPDFWSNPLYAKITITPEPVMIDMKIDQNTTDIYCYWRFPSFYYSSFPNFLLIFRFLPSFNYLIVIINWLFLQVTKYKSKIAMLLNTQCLVFFFTSLVQRIWQKLILKLFLKAGSKALKPRLHSFIY